MREAKALRLAVRYGFQPYARLGFTPRVVVRRQLPREGWTTITVTLRTGKVPIDQFTCSWRHLGDQEQQLAMFVLGREVDAMTLRVGRLIETAITRMLDKARRARRGS